MVYEPDPWFLVAVLMVSAVAWVKRRSVYQAYVLQVWSRWFWRRGRGVRRRQISIPTLAWTHNGHTVWADEQRWPDSLSVREAYYEELSDRTLWDVVRGRK